MLTIVWGWVLSVMDHLVSIAERDGPTARNPEMRNLRHTLGLQNLFSGWWMLVSLTEINW